jgi:hypothetical protein
MSNQIDAGTVQYCRNLRYKNRLVFRVRRKQPYAKITPQNHRNTNPDVMEITSTSSHVAICAIQKDRQYPVSSSMTPPSQKPNEWKWMIKQSYESQPTSRTLPSVHSQQRNTISNPHSIMQQTYRCSRHMLSTSYRILHKAKNAWIMFVNILGMTDNEQNRRRSKQKRLRQLAMSDKTRTFGE